MSSGLGGGTVGFLAMLSGSVLVFGVPLLVAGGSFVSVLGSTFLGFLGAVGLSFDLDDLGVVNETVDQRCHRELLIARAK